MRYATRKNIIILIVFLVQPIVIVEFLSFVSIRYFISDAIPYLLYKQPAESLREDFELYMDHHDPLLGWPSPNQIGRPPFDAAGARYSPAFPQPGNACIAAYGDSFVWADEVKDSEAWTNVLSEKLGCRVANYGIGGYGTDQSFLRFRQNDEGEKLVILGIFPHNIMRNVNQNRYFIVGSGNYFRLKPRFIINAQGNLELISIPDLSRAKFPDIATHPGYYFKYETFLPGSDFGSVKSGFPYTLTVLRLLSNNYFDAHIKSFFDSSPVWMEFLAPDHPSQALAVTKKIVAAFSHEATARKRQLIIVVFPTPRTFKYFERTGTWAYENLIAAIKDDVGYVEVVNLGVEFRRVLGDKSYCEILTHATQCEGHLNANGNKILAAIVLSKIRDRIIERRQ